MLYKEKENLALLICLAELGAAYKPVLVKTRQLGEILNISQQSASRQLIELENRGLIERRTSHRGQYVILTEKGLSVLREIYYVLKQVFDRDTGRVVVLRGTVFTGLGEGAFYVSLEPYRKQFKEKLGFDPYPGTLNLKLDDESIKARRLLETLPGIQIEPFRDEKRAYGGAKAFKALVNNEVEAAVLILERTHYGPDVLEVIAPICLRKRFNLKDGDLVALVVFLDTCTRKQ